MLRGVSASFFGIPSDQFAIGEITVTGQPAPTVQTVRIDVVPDSAANVVTGRTVEVAVLSSAGFNAFRDVDTSSLTFGRTGDELSRESCNTRRAPDVNHDGRGDLVCDFFVGATGLTPADAAAVLKGATTAGTPITGSDTVVVA